MRGGEEVDEEEVVLMGLIRVVLVGAHEDGGGGALAGFELLFRVAVEEPGVPMLEHYILVFGE